MLDYQKFKTAIVKGFDKDEVLNYIQKMEEEGYAKDAEFAKALKAKDAKIEELKKRISLKEEQKERLENEIEQKYKKYIDNYDRIGRLVFEAELKADAITEEAQKKADALIEEAQKKADAILADAEKSASIRSSEAEQEINEKLAEGKKKYIAVQEEMNGIVELINQAQKRFMASYKDVHKIIQSMPSSLDDMGDEQDLIEDFAEEDTDFMEEFDDEVFEDEELAEDTELMEDNLDEADTEE